MKFVIGLIVVVLTAIGAYFYFTGANEDTTSAPVITGTTDPAPAPTPEPASASAAENAAPTIATPSIKDIEGHFWMSQNRSFYNFTLRGNTSYNFSDHSMSPDGTVPVTVNPVASCTNKIADENGSALEAYGGRCIQIVQIQNDILTLSTEQGITSAYVRLTGEPAQAMEATFQSYLSMMSEQTND